MLWRKNLKMNLLIKLKKILNFPVFLWDILVLKGRNASFDARHLMVWGKLGLTGRGKINIGSEVIIVSGSVNPIAGIGFSHFTVPAGGQLDIENDCKISNCCITAVRHVQIGKRVLIGSNTMIADTDFHVIDSDLRKSDDFTHVKVAPVVIEDDVFIGARCIILKGVTIGRGAVIGAGSVVARDIPENEIWCGNPARFIRKVK